MIIGIHHVNISIPSGAEEQARSFYGTLLGLDEIEKPDALKANGGLWFMAGNLEVHIGIQDAVNRQALKAHIAYQVADLSAWRDTLEQAGIPIKENTPIPEFDRFEIRDPFGNRIEFVQLR